MTVMIVPVMKIHNDCLRSEITIEENNTTTVRWTEETTTKIEQMIVIDIFSNSPISYQDYCFCIRQI